VLSGVGLGVVSGRAQARTLGPGLCNIMSNAVFTAAPRLGLGVAKFKPELIFKLLFYPSHHRATGMIAVLVPA
jgi:hypothetical protein